MAERESVGEGPLAGIRVLEMSSWIMTPTAGALLAAHGADVVKIESARAGDPLRRLNWEPGDLQAGYELANNRKRAIQLNSLSSPDAQQIVHRLLERADVFLTNVRPAALDRAGLSPESLVARYPQLIVAHGTGYGPSGREAGRPAFDELAYWARAGIATALQVEGQPPVSLVGALGDLPSAVSLVAGILMALFRRERQGTGGVVDVSLYQGGIWANGGVIAGALTGRAPREKRTRATAHSPLYTSYQCADGAWIQLAMIPPMRYWTTFCEVLNRRDLLQDPRFATFDDFTVNSAQAIAELEVTIGSMNRDEIASIFDENDLPWSPIFSADDVVNDDQARANGYILSKMHRSGVEMETVAPPFSLRGFSPLLEPAPEPGQHTEEVLLEAGYSWDDIAQMRENDVY